MFDRCRSKGLPRGMVAELPVQIIPFLDRSNTRRELSLYSATAKCPYPSSAATMQLSAERPALPEMETIWSELPRDGKHLGFACFQRDLLGEHDVSDRQSANWHETQSLP